MALGGVSPAGTYSFNDSLSQLVLDYVIILLEDSWILSELAKQALESVYAQLVVVWQRIMELSQGSETLLYLPFSNLTTPVKSS